MDLVCTDGASAAGRGRANWRVFPSLRNGIESEFPRKRLATQQSFQREPRPAQNAESFHRFIGIPRAGRLKPAATSKQHRQVRLIKVQREQRHPHTHLLRRHSVFALLAPSFEGSLEKRNVGRQSFYTLCSSRSRSAVSAANGARAMALFGCMTMSHPAGIS